MPSPLAPPAGEGRNSRLIFFSSARGRGEECLLFPLARLRERGWGEGTQPRKTSLEFNFPDDLSLQHFFESRSPPHFSSTRLVRPGCRGAIPAALMAGGRNALCRGGVGDVAAR